MTDDIEVRIARTLAKRSLEKPGAPSGPAVKLMRELLDEDNLQGYARLYIVIEQARRANLPHVSGSIPAQIRGFLVKHRGVDVSSLEAWVTDNSGWEDELRDTLRNPPMFEAKVEAIAGEIKDRET